MQRLYYFFLIIMVCSCTSYPEAIEDVLRQAGVNRKELEKVLNHYSKNPSDSLKLRAAELLIVNMPGKYSEYYDAPWYEATNIRNEALEMAQVIIDKGVKIPSHTVTVIKNEMRRLIEAQETTNIPERDKRRSDEPENIDTRQGETPEVEPHGAVPPP